MLLGELASRLQLPSTAQFDADRVVTAVTHDSRLAAPGTIFIAVPGFRMDGTKFIPDAVDRGSNVVVCAQLPEELLPGVSYLLTADVRSTMAQIARELNGRPDELVRLYGVTGTNGKTSTAYFLSAILRHAKRRVGVMGTIGFDVDGKIIETPNTTPEAPILHDLIRTAVEGGTEDIIMEVSSHSLELQRVSGMVFDVAMFTNLTEDHLELHGTMEEYYCAKKRLFGQATTGHAVVDIGSPWGERAADEIAAAGNAVIRVGRTDQEADVRPEHTQTGLTGTTFDLVTASGRVPVQLRALGTYHVRNALVAAGAALAQGYPLEVIAEGLSAAEPVLGRLERVINDDGLDVFIDYAHTTDALDSCLTAVRALTDRPITLVFGVLGDRIPRLRKEMGTVAAAGADYIILTEDDLKVSSLAEVVADVGGALDAAGAEWELIENRWDAIAAGVARARAGDVVIVAGKGHERQLILPDGGGIVHLDEVEAVKTAMAGQNPRILDPRELRVP
ncbi:UDP-N-acetylmuramoyl-L-alanyl-D-glutamate--2,6-diaminopimelate ligase [Gulosibacter chungangensis]|uniref:UDP-N-acetylmuramyl-tripeptide synthetase n=1 Tax=Gulosibacter chungangensis TaxID=979746 RepID=A0A7J5B9H7_9MICO|nr:UDP-N-acetylmuramoyl-L-alanyl-D-glutamate--2,6-diaminopimelate ligase [Gulosibacter chungangensis]KAB1642281.1 UDP-N-acetylmuramoyl-L-alanyl-D-glutamate--2,6-diaminopimelate ligase [Gulosibacter chungangensis]